MHLPCGFQPIGWGHMNLIAEPLLKNFKKLIYEQSS